MTDKIRGTPKLTTKQEKFVQELIKGKSQREAYINAGYKYNKDRMDVVDVKASELFKNGKVAVRYQQLKGDIIEKAEKEVLFSYERLIEEWLELLGDSKMDKNYNGRTKALTELATLFDYYPKEEKVKDEPTKIVFNIESVPKKGEE